MAFRAKEDKLKKLFAEETEEVQFEDDFDDGFDDDIAEEAPAKAEEPAEEKAAEQQPEQPEKQEEEQPAQEPEEKTEETSEESAEEEKTEEEPEEKSDEAEKTEETEAAETEAKEGEEAPAAELEESEFDGEKTWSELSELAMKVKRLVAVGAFFRANDALAVMRGLLVELICRDNGIDRNFEEKVDSLCDEDKQLVYATYPTSLDRTELLRVVGGIMNAALMRV